MTATQIGTLLAYILVFGYTPGPANLYSLLCALRHGRSAALTMWWGLLAGFTIEVWSVAALCYCLGSAVHDYIGYVRYAGAAYLLWLAWSTATCGDRPTERSGCSFKTGLVLQLTNAKMILFNLLMFGNFGIANGANVRVFLLIGILLYIAGPGGNLAWLFGGHFLRRLYKLFPRAVDVVLGSTLAVFAVLLLF